MPDCDYCDAAFEDEESYLDHLAEEHRGELSRIDRRRVEDRIGEEGISTGAMAGAAIGILVFAGLVGTFVLGGGGGGGGPTDVGNFSGDPETKALPDKGNQQLLQGVESFSGLSTGHVADPQYSNLPPVGGPHLSRSVPAGYYTNQQSLGALVHSLEHGGVIVYYDPSAITPDARKSLRQFVSAQSGQMRPVIAVPNPRDDPRSAYVLTAWGQRLRMDSYDPLVVRAFMAQYLGRGPEQPVR